MWLMQYVCSNIVIFFISAEKIYEDYNHFRAVITHRGLVHWEPGGRTFTLFGYPIQ